tara:strand:- start:1036 stop:1734 length:699 start_codon:yes stop_codon:yes gene_type:complete
MNKNFTKYSLEFVVIIFGILISFFLEERRQNAIEISKKNDSIKQLLKVIEEDINQIDRFIDLQNFSLSSCNLIFENLKKNNLMSNDSIIYHLSSVGRGLRSFFPQEGVFNQLISSDLIKRIDSEDLKINLFKLFNEDLKRHEVHTKEYDVYFLDFNYKLSVNFFLEDEWSIGADPVKIQSYKFNQKYYFSDYMYGDLIELKSSMISYLKELNQLKKTYSTLRNLCNEELKVT